MKRKITAAVRRLRRERLDQCIEHIKAGDALPFVQRCYALAILQRLREGYDVREFSGVKPKHGAPPTTEGWQKWMASYYFKLCELEPKKLAKVHAATVATACGTTVRVVQNIASKWRSEALEGLDQYPLVEIIWHCDRLTKYKRIHREPRRWL